MEFSEEELEEVLNIFREESEEQIQKLNENLLRLEANPQDEKIIQDIFREAHSLKGSARMIGLDDIQTIAHKLEDIFGLARKGELSIKPEVVDILCTAVDAIASIIQDTIKTKGTHSIDVESTVNQLKMIESGEMYKYLSVIPKEKTILSITPEFSEDIEEDVVVEDKYKVEQDIEAIDSGLDDDVRPQSIEEKQSIIQEDFSDEELSELKQIFYAESRQHVDFIIECVNKLKQFPCDREVLAEAYRSVHLLDGSTRIINFREIRDYIHSIRNIFEQAMREEKFISLDKLAALEKGLNKIKDVISKNYDNEGYETQLNLEQLEKRIELKMEMYKKKEDKPKKSPKAKISLSSNTLNFDEKAVLKDIAGKKESDKPQTEKEILKKQLEINPLALSDEELGDLEIGTLKGIKPLSAFERMKKELEEKDTKLTELSTDMTKAEDESSVIETIDVLLGLLSDDLNDLSNNLSDKNIIEKINYNIEKIKNLALKENNQEVMAIISKVETIILEVKAGKLFLNNDMAIVIAQSLESLKTFAADDTQDVIEDPSLIYQRLMILHQTARLSSGIPFEEELEPEIFQREKQKEDELATKDEKGNISKVMKNVEYEGGEYNQERTSSLMSKPGSSVYASKTTVSPVGQMSMEKEATSLDLTESYTIKTLRVDTRKLDQLVAQVGELIIAKIKAKERLTDVEKLINLVEEWQRDWSKAKYTVKNIDRKTLKSTFMPEGTSIYTPTKDMQTVIRSNSDMLAQLTNNLNVIYRNIQEDDTRLTLIINELEDRIKNVRLLPLATIFNMFPRMVRDIARQQNKEIELEIRGSETTVDKKIIEEIKSPLMHIIRNSIDHGIETPEERENKGKPATGRIILSARHLENSVMIEIIDDGRGIDLEAIKAKVLEKELLTMSELDAMTETQIMNIIFWPGFSTGQEITDISGRGVGMDVVHTKITQLNGQVKVRSKLEEGCKVSIQLPVTMATIQVFLVRILNQTYAIPASAIKSAVLVKPTDIFYKEGRQTMLVEGVPVFLARLDNLLELPKAKQETVSKKDKLTVLVLQTEDTNIGFIVDGLLGDQEILHKNLEPPLVRVRNVAGVTTLGSGEVCLILNVGDLIKTAHMTCGMALRSSYQKKEIQIQKKEILVVDDSVTTRILERNILRAAGYNVTVAVNGLDALTKLSTQPFDLIVSDVEMPDISGYELTSRIKKDDILSKIPVVLVTSLASELDRQKGMSAGASAYITKGSFDQEELLGTIRRLLV